MAEEFQIGDPVWAKMKGYPPWPAKIVSPPPNAKPQKNKHFVFFFGSNNNAWILDEHISHHNEQQLLNSASKKKIATLQNAIDELVCYAKSYTGKRPSSPQKVEEEKSKVRKTPTKIIKLNNSVSEKHKRSVLLSKSLIKSKKRSLENLNGSAKYVRSKSSKYKRQKCAISNMAHFLPPVYLSIFGSDLPREKIFRNTHKPVKPSSLRFGFIGMGVLGKSIVRTLLKCGHDVTVWNRTAQHCDMVLIFGAKRALSPAELVVNCDVLFCCVTDPEAIKAIIFSEHGVLSGLMESISLGKGRKGFVNLTITDPETADHMSEAVQQNAGFYLEAPVWGTCEDAEQGKLLVIAAGDRILFSECETCFQAIGQNAYYLSCNPGEANKVILGLNTVYGTMCATLAEVLATAERLKLQKEDFFEGLRYGKWLFPILLEKGLMMINMSFSRITALKHMQKNMDLILKMAYDSNVFMPVTVAANESYKRAKMRKMAEDDVIAVYKAVKF